MRCPAEHASLPSIEARRLANPTMSSDYRTGTDVALSLCQHLDYGHITRQLGREFVRLTVQQSAVWHQQ